MHVKRPPWTPTQQAALTDFVLYKEAESCTAGTRPPSSAELAHAAIGDPLLHAAVGGRPVPALIRRIYAVRGLLASERWTPEQDSALERFINEQEDVIGYPLGSITLAGMAMEQGLHYRELGYHRSKAALVARIQFIQAKVAAKGRIRAGKQDW